MNQDEVESQLSAMFDGELPAAECELLSRRIDRDERLRARWSRYALIGAAMRCEPVATASSEFAGRVSRGVDGVIEARTGRLRRHRYVWQSALAASLVGAVAGLSLLMLRHVAYESGVPVIQSAGAALRASPSARLAAVALQPGAGTALDGQGSAQSAAAAAAAAHAREPFSYVTPANDAADPTGLRTELVDYIVAHSEYSTPLMRPDLLSALIGGDDAADDTVHEADGGSAGAGGAVGRGSVSSANPAGPSAAGVAARSTAAAGDADGPTAAAASGR